ncbi:AraC family transcriptional regulator ligand-binding domain-containing protein [Sorangium atrum]|uniref:AraC family transcriptional regulator ligand-binding domain-containing protein n=1 Tax=Sorangium atrum TaxID=2995308 RepID=UPI00358DC9E6
MAQRTLATEGRALAATVEEDAHEARWLLRTPRRPRGVGRYVHELALAHALHHVRAGAADLAPARVWFTHARPPDLAVLRAFFGTGAIAFGAKACPSSKRRDAPISRWAPLQQNTGRTRLPLAPLQQKNGSHPSPAGRASTKR